MLKVHNSRVLYYRIGGACIYFLLALTQVSCAPQKTEERPGVHKILKQARRMAALMEDSLDKYRTLYEIVSAQIVSEDIMGASKNAESIHDLILRNGAFYKIAVAQARAGEINQALGTVFRIKTVSWFYFSRVDEPNGVRLREQARSEIAEIQAQRGDIKGAFRTVDLINEMDMRAISLARIAIVQKRAGDQDGGGETLQLAFQRVTSIEQRFNRDGALIVISNIQAKAGDIEGALQTASSLHDESKIWALGVIAETQAGIGKIKEAFQTVSLIPPNSGKDVVLVYIAKVQAQSGDIKGAIETTDNMEDKASKANSFANIAAAYAKNGAPVAATKMIQLALQSAQAIQNETSREFPLVSIVKAQMEINDLSGAIQTVALVPETSKYAAFATIARGQAKAGDLMSAFQTANFVTGSKAAIFENIARVQTKTGNVKSALLWVEKINIPEEKASALLGIAWGLLCSPKREDIPVSECFSE